MTALATAVLEVVGLTVRYGGVVAVDEVGFSVTESRIMGLIGPNGAGKTSLVDALTGYTRPASGTVRFHGRDITGDRPHRLARRGLGRTFQSVELFRDLSVLENLLAASDPQGVLFGLSRMILPSREKYRERVGWALDLMDLNDVSDRLPGELSYGQAKLVGVARALASGASMLLLDEPAAGLDSDATALLADRLRVVAAEGLTLLLIDHDMSLVLNVCDRIVVLDFGRKIAEGAPNEIRRNPKVIEAYLGSGVHGASAPA